MTKVVNIKTVQVGNDQEKVEIRKYKLIARKQPVRMYMCMHDYHHKKIEIRCGHYVLLSNNSVCN